MTTQTFIDVSHLKHFSRTAIARRFNVKLDWHSTFGKRRYVLCISAGRTAGALVREIEAAVNAAN